MNRILKTGFVVLSVVTIVTVYATAVAYSSSIKLFGDLRDYFPSGLWIKAHEADSLPGYIEVSDDPYVKAAIDSINETKRWDWVEDWMWERDVRMYNKTINEGWVWVFQEKFSLLNSTHFHGGYECVHWLPDDRYYHIQFYWTDGVPDWWKKVPFPAETTAVTFSMTLGIPWVGLILFAVKKKQR